MIYYHQTPESQCDVEDGGTPAAVPADLVSAPPAPAHQISPGPDA